MTHTQLLAQMRATAEAERNARFADVLARAGGGCYCPPCPGRGYDGPGLLHCAECCFGSGVEADIDCPIHGEAAVLARFTQTPGMRNPSAQPEPRRGPFLPDN